MGPKVKKILGDIAWNELSECMLAVKNTIHGVLKIILNRLSRFFNLLKIFSGIPYSGSNRPYRHLTRNSFLYLLKNRYVE